MWLQRLTQRPRVMMTQMLMLERSISTTCLSQRWRLRSKAWRPSSTRTVQEKTEMAKGQKVSVLTRPQGKPKLVPPRLLRLLTQGLVHQLPRSVKRTIWSQRTKGRLPWSSSRKWSTPSRAITSQMPKSSQPLKSFSYLRRLQRSYAESRSRMTLLTEVGAMLLLTGSSHCQMALFLM